MSTFPHVTVLGAGVLGSQIGFQAALHGKEVTLWDISDEALDVARGRAEAIVPDYVREVPSGDEQVARAAVAGLRWTSEESRSFAEMLQRDYLAHGRVGRESGEGFYRYDEHGRQL